MGIEAHRRRLKKAFGVEHAHFIWFGPFFNILGRGIVHGCQASSEEANSLIRDRHRLLCWTSIR